MYLTLQFRCIFFAEEEFVMQQGDVLWCREEVTWCRTGPPNATGAFKNTTHAPRNFPTPPNATAACRNLITRQNATDLPTQQMRQVLFEI